MKSTLKWSLLIATAAMSSSIAIAQPGTPAGNPQAPNTRPQRPDRPERPRMSLGDRRKETEDKLREMMSSNGVTDNSAQNAVLSFLSNEMEARRPLRQMGVKLQRALSDPSISDDQIKALVADYQNAQVLETQRRTKAQSDLNDSIHYRENPRLQGLLMLMGVLGDGPPLMEGPRGPRGPRGPENRPNNAGNKGRGNPEMRQEILKKFDKNNDGKLDAEERAAMQAERGNRQKEKGAQTPTPPDAD